MTIKFDIPKHSSSIIKVIGVGGGGSNAVNHMYRQGIQGVDFIVSNTDQQALEASPIPNKIQLGSSLTEGLGAGAVPETGRKAALETIDEIKDVLKDKTKMLFITAGMGGGTGTGAAPVIAQVAKEMGILTVGIVTKPFSFEGKKRKQQAEEGIEEMRKYVDTLLVICNDKLRELYSDLKLSEAFKRADDILTTAAKGIAEIITVSGYINVDFADVSTVMRNGGVALMGTGVAEGEDRAVKAIEMALSSPLLNDNDINGAKNILLYISSGKEEITMDEVTEITDYIQNAAGLSADIIWGNGYNEALGDKISVTLIATGFNKNDMLEPGEISQFQSSKIVKTLEIENSTTTQKPQTDAHQEEEFVVFTKNINSEETKQSHAETDIKENSFANSNEQTKENTVTKNTSDPDEEIFLIKKQEPTEVAEKTETKKVYSLFDTDNSSNGKTESIEKISIEKKEQERTEYLRIMSQKLKNQEGLEEIIKQPAYIRKNIQLDNTKPSSESSISRLSLGPEEDNTTGIKPNPFLHDNVD